MEHDLDGVEALRVDLAALRRRGVDRHELAALLPAAWLAQAVADTDAEVTEAGRIQLELLLQPEGVIVARGPLSAAFTVPCGRCLAPAAVDASTEIFATFMPGADERRDEEEEIDDEDLEPDADSPDVWRYDGPILALAGLVHEQVALGYPMRALCTHGEQCRGLCSNCGHELNTLPAEARTCPKCKNPVPLTPEADLPNQGESEPRQARELASNPLADALRKLKID